MFESFVEQGAVSGVVALRSRDGETSVEVHGRSAVDGVPLRRDSVFRISSLTKPIVAAAAMTLVDSGRLRLDAPVDELLPELAAMRVLRQPDGPIDDTVPLARPITVEDLLTHRLGLGETDHPGLRALEAELELRTFGPPKPRTPWDPDEWMRRLGTMPLQYQPGERWLYSTGSHVLGVLVARAAGKGLEEYLRERFFGPLGMTSTGFTATDLGRLTTLYADGEVLDSAVGSQWAEPPVFPDAGGGLVSTADDFHAFAAMLLAGGNGILSPAAVELMTTDHLTAAQREAATAFLDGDGWGFGVSPSADSYGWGGGLGSLWTNAPAPRTVTLVLTTQALWTWPPELFAAVVDPSW
ncbi:CubicO group peptidase (beta-lactamase class C family) [Kribbella amoyensis]|uniref:CubicO group peptidase (Beta-lactamase class C family) n=1 Tax=Kribbella amoyensis TaxID=996641 RepID=A0A561BJN1_9ACTN|nr:serine hydrolase domain-containing protein [Kribbella amoyensis]TWD79089.1 CubicO group peptidase (beta-lactamase class C family) [Kribbella amoyensis]